MVEDRAASDEVNAEGTSLKAAMIFSASAILAMVVVQSDKTTAERGQYGLQPSGATTLEAIPEAMAKKQILEQSMSNASAPAPVSPSTIQLMWLLLQQQ